MSPVSPDERERIAQALRDGESIHGVAKANGRSKDTVFRIAQEIGIERSGPKKATQARRDYSLVARLDLLNAGFDKAQEILQGVAEPHQLQQWTVAVGTLIDKRRLEDGESTSRTEISDPSAARQRLASKLDELASRRTEKAVA